MTARIVRLAASFALLTCAACIAAQLATFASVYALACTWLALGFAVLAAGVAGVAITGERGR